MTHGSAPFLLHFTLAIRNVVRYLVHGVKELEFVEVSAIGPIHPINHYLSLLLSSGSQLFDETLDLSIAFTGKQLLFLGFDSASFRAAGRSSFSIGNKDILL